MDMLVGEQQIFYMVGGRSAVTFYPWLSKVVSELVSK
jgi:hypothetical protein